MKYSVWISATVITRPSAKSTGARNVRSERRDLGANQPPLLAGLTGLAS